MIAGNQSAMLETTEEDIKRGEAMMGKSTIKIVSTKYSIGVIPQLSSERSIKVERLKRAVAEGTYQIDSKKLVNKLIKLILLAGDSGNCS
jgi:anti-sigma28 factor (negative regulator of flagellin synthesis)